MVVQKKNNSVNNNVNVISRNTVKKKSVNNNVMGQNLINKTGVRVPIAAKLISILYFALALFFILLGLIMFFSGAFFGAIGVSLLESIPVLSVIGSVLGLFLIITGIIFVLIGIMYLLVGIGLFRGKNWARIVVIIFSFIGVFISFGGILSFNISAMIWSIFWISLDLVIVIYLIVSKDVKGSFK